MPKNSDLGYLYDPELTDVDYSGYKDIAERAKDRVVTLFNSYEKMRTYSEGGVEINIEDKFDENYRLYKTIFNEDDHNYDGEAKVCLPVARKAINVIESESSNALFGRDDYYSFEAIGTDDLNVDMARRAFQVIKHYSDEENYVGQFDLALKQCLIYGATCVELVFYKEEHVHKYRKLEKTPLLDEETGDQLVDEQSGELQWNYEYVLKSDLVKIKRPRIEVRDIYSVYVNPAAEEPEKEDIIYRDYISAQDLLTMVDHGAYNKKAVMKMLETRPSYNNSANINDKSNTGRGRPKYIGGLDDRDKINDEYEVLRFQGLFTIVDTEKNTVRQEQFLIDVGEREHVLRCEKNPFFGQYKTFSFCNYDTMVNEFYTDGIIDPIKSLQYEIDDKENQSLDGVDFQINAPYEVEKSSGLRASDFIKARKVPNSPLFVRKIGSVKKLQDNINTSHLNAELIRLNNYVDNTTGATSIAAGQPSGTQADRSGKALDLLQNQTRSQFSKFIRKFERSLLETSIKKAWMLIMQFSDETVEIELTETKTDDQGKPKEVKTPYQQNVAEIVGQFNIRVQGGSQYLKEREMRDSILEFVAVLGTWDVWREMVIPDKMLKDIASASPHDMSKYVDPNNFYNQQKQQIEQLQQITQQMEERLQAVGGENVRLQNELRQTDRSNMVSPPIVMNGDILGTKRKAIVGASPTG